MKGDAFLTHELQHRDRVLSSTWGHLFPQGKVYHGKITLAEDLYGQICILKEDIEIGASPWWYQALMDWAFEYLRDSEPGRVYVAKVLAVVDDERDPQIKLTTEEQ